MTQYLGRVIVLDIEGPKFMATIDGKNKIEYTTAQVLQGKHMDDYPGYNVVSEAAHFSPKPVDKTDRGAQPYTNDERNIYINNVESRQVKHLLLPGSMAKKIMHKLGYKSPDSCLAWWHYADSQEKVRSQIHSLRPITDKDRNRNIALNAIRADSCRRIDAVATDKYCCLEVENCREILHRAAINEAISTELWEYFRFKWIKSGPRKGLLDFQATWVMPYYVVCCEVDGKYRRNNRGDRMSPKEIIGGVLQQQPYKCGMGSKASARAKTRQHLTDLEHNYRVKHGLPLAGAYPDGIPEVRRLDQKMNREMVKIFRNYAD